MNEPYFPFYFTIMQRLQRRKQLPVGVYGWADASVCWFIIAQLAWLLN